MVSTNRKFKWGSITRLSSFNHFIKTKFIQFYSILSRLTTQAFYKPLVMPFAKPSGEDPLATEVDKLKTDQEFKEYLKRQLCSVLDYDVLSSAFVKWSVEMPSARREGKAFSGFERKMTMTKFVNYLLVSCSMGGCTFPIHSHIVCFFLQHFICSGR